MMPVNLMTKSVFGPQRSQLMCLLQSANYQFANFLNLEKGLLKRQINIPRTIEQV